MKSSKHTTVKLSFLRILRLLLRRNILRQHDRWSREKIELYQQHALEALRKHAYRNSAFYKKFHATFFDKPLHELPILTKKELMANWNDIVIDPGLEINEIRNFIKESEKPRLYKGQYYISTTSGTTGLKGVFAFSKDEWLWGLASHGRATEWAGANIGLFNRLKMAVVSSTKSWCKSLLVGASIDTAILPTTRLDSTSPLDEIVKNLNDFGPEVLVAYAGTGKALAKQQLKGNLRIAPEMVFTSSEILTQRTKELIKEAWAVQPYNAYACTEGALLAADCKHHRMHLCEDLVIVEVVDQNNQPVSKGVYGDKLLITVLFSHTLPLIRYEISDSILIVNSTENCSCKRPFAIVGGIQGRVEDTIYLTGADGKVVAVKPDAFHDVLEPAPLGGWQIIQQSRTDILVSIVDPLNDYDEVKLLSELNARLKEQGASNPGIRIQIVPRLEQSSIGKIPLVKAL